MNHCSSKKTRVLIVCKGHQNIAGAQLYLKQISTILLSEGCELHYAFHPGDGNRVFIEIDKIGHVNQWQYDWRYLPFHSSIKEGIRLYRQIMPDLVIFNGSSDDLLAPVWASWLTNIRKRIMIVHWAESKDSLPLFYKKPGFPLPVPSRYSLKKRLIRGISLNLLHKILFVNTGTREAYIHLYNIPKENCSTIYNGIDPSQFSNIEVLRKSTRDVLNVDDNEFSILATGNLSEEKGHIYLIEAISILKQRNIPVKCFIAGQGNLKLELERKINDFGMKNYIKLLGYREDVPALLAGADIFTMPSLSEALPYSLLEAMAAGLPIVASRVGGIPEVITHGKEGYLVNPENVKELANAIETLTTDFTLRQLMGKMGKETIMNKFSSHQMLSNTKDFLKKQIDSNY